MKTANTYIYAFGLLLASALATGCTSDNDGPGTDNDAPLRLLVDGTPWHEEQVAMTRSGETLEALKHVSDPKAATDGFGLYCSDSHMPLANLQVTWDNTNACWTWGSYPYYLHRGFVYTDIYAYAPRISDAALLTPPTEGIIAISSNILTFAPGWHNDIDLLWAERGTSDGAVTLTFKHALGKISFGTITNRYGQNITLKSITIGGTRIKQADLDLSSGTWTWNSSSDEESVARTDEDFDETEGGNQPLAVPDGETKALAIKTGATTTKPIEPALQIPGPTVELTVTINTAAYGDETFSKNIQLEQGIDKLVNIRVTENHEVVIED